LVVGGFESFAPCYHLNSIDEPLPGLLISLVEHDSLFDGIQGWLRIIFVYEPLEHVDSFLVSLKFVVNRFFEANLLDGLPLNIFLFVLPLGNFVHEFVI